MKNPKQIEIGEWLFYGCFIQENSCPNIDKYTIFKNNKGQSHIGTCNTFAEAKSICAKNKNEENYLKFN